MLDSSSCVLRKAVTRGKKRHSTIERKRAHCHLLTLFFITISPEICWHKNDSHQRSSTIMGWHLTIWLYHNTRTVGHCISQFSLSYRRDLSRQIKTLSLASFLDTDLGVFVSQSASSPSHSLPRPHERPDRLPSTSVPVEDAREPTVATCPHQPTDDGDGRGRGSLRLATRRGALYVTVKYVLSSVENGWDLRFQGSAWM